MQVAGGDFGGCPADECILFAGGTLGRVVSDVGKVWTGFEDFAAVEAANDFAGCQRLSVAVVVEVGRFGQEVVAG